MSSPFNDRLILAARRGDLKALRAALESGANINATDRNLETALHQACRYDQALIVEELLKHSAQLQYLGAGNGNGLTPLMAACSRRNLSGTVSIVRRLLETYDKFDINATCDMGRTALHMACACSSKEVVRLLLDAGASCDAMDDDDDTPLILASQFGDSDMVRQILAHDPRNIRNTNNSGKDALGSAITNLKARDQIIPLLLNKGLQLDPEDASKIFFDFEPSRKVAKSPWLRTVQTMLENHNVRADRPLYAVIEPILEFASKEDKVTALVEATTKSHFQVFASLTEDLAYNENACKLVWLERRDEKSATIAYKELLGALQDHLSPDDLKQELTPTTSLQWSAYYGDYIFVWYLMKNSQPKDSDQQHALRIAMGRQSTERQTQGRLRHNFSGLSDDYERDATGTGNSERNEHTGRFAYTIIMLSSPSVLKISDETLMSISRKSIQKKLPKRPTQEELEDKKAILRKHHATIVDVYKNDDQIDLLRSSRSVLDEVYAETDPLANASEEKTLSVFHEMTDTTAIQGTYKQGKRQLRWVHLPANNLAWMEHLTLRMYKDKELDDERTASFFDLVQRSRIELPTEKSSIKFMKPLCLKEEIVTEKERPSRKGRSRSETQKNDNNQRMYGTDSRVPGILQSSLTGTTERPAQVVRGEAKVNHQRMAYYTPYITFGRCLQESQGPLQRSSESSFDHFYEDLIVERQKHIIEKHAELKKQYEESIFHGPRSLDRFYYNALEKDKMDERDQSQVVTRELLQLEMGELPAGDCQIWPYLTVDQLWVWVIDEDTIITSSTHREDGLDKLLVDMVFVQLDKLSQQAVAEELSSATKLGQFLMRTCADFINHLSWQNIRGGYIGSQGNREAASKSIMMLFADRLNKAADNEKELVRNFKRRIAIEMKKSERSEKEKERLMTSGDRAKTQQRHGIHQLKKEHDNNGASEGLKSFEGEMDDWKTMNEAAVLLDEVKDIREELVMLNTLHLQQEDVLKSLMGPIRSDHFTANELDEMIKMTDTIQRSIKDLLNLNLVDKSANQSKALVTLAERAEKQSESLVKLAERADQQSLENARQSVENAKQEKVLFAFAIVTVIFTPMSFMTSILALNTSTSRHNDDGELEWEPVFMYWMIFGVSAAIVAPFLGYAFLHKVKTLLLWLISSSAWVSCRIGLMYTRMAKSVREDASPESRRSGDLEKGQTARNNTSGTPSDIQPKENTG